jgi:hypothetical protein
MLALCPAEFIHDVITAVGVACPTAIFSALEPPNSNAVKHFSPFGLVCDQYTVVSSALNMAVSSNDSFIVSAERPSLALSSFTFSSTL